MVIPPGHKIIYIIAQMDEKGKAFSGFFRTKDGKFSGSAHRMGQ
jgi:hypothetical protein